MYSRIRTGFLIIYLVFNVVPSHIASSLPAVENVILNLGIELRWFSLMIFRKTLELLCGINMYTVLHRQKSCVCTLILYTTLMRTRKCKLKFEKQLVKIHFATGQCSVFIDTFIIGKDIEDRYNIIT